jgi:nucleotide-binding universal stress UspA family protein
MTRRTRFGALLAVAAVSPPGIRLLHYGHSSVALLPASRAELPLAPEGIPAIRRVLVTTDFSPLASFAVPYGYALLGEGGGEVFLLHVLPEAEAGEAPGVVARLRALVPKEAGGRGIVTRTEVAHGSDPAAAICETAERVGADALCIASHGHSGLRKAIRGSVAEAVIRRSLHPVLLVRPPSL